MHKHKYKDKVKRLNSVERIILKRRTKKEGYSTSFLMSHWTNINIKS